MTQSRSGGPGKNAGRDTAKGQGSGRGRGGGYTPKPKTLKVGLCKELESHIFDYGGSNAANLMRMMQEKIAHWYQVRGRYS
jgi:hypothetical protein